MVSSHRNPSLGPVTLEYRFTEQQFLVTILESCEDFRPREIPLGEILINRSIKLLEGVRKTFVVAAGIAGERADAGREQGGIPDQQFVWFVSMPEPEVIRCSESQASDPSEPAISIVI